MNTSPVVLRLEGRFTCLLLVVVALFGAACAQRGGHPDGWTGATRRARAAPTRGENWISPTTGMMFIWISELGFWVGRYEVTNGEYRKKESGHSSGDYEGQSLDGDRQPVVYVDFDEAERYATWLTDQDVAVAQAGLRYRLPLEREFVEFAKCGDDRRYPWGDLWPPESGKAGNYSDESARKLFSGWRAVPGYEDGHAVSAPVEESGAQSWGLSGVGGNVWEFCRSDDGDGSFGAMRGASWANHKREELRIAQRNAFGGSARSGNYGFRLVLAPAPIRP
ncbi:MAG: SUMF1/EgtB/PvdO family nonheme iron enzyme [Kiritimatiellia bacterium]|nr:SUMF1/EgtB/PvdO family nonheme iron enzyme [Kiritimatiellia bacterium]